MVLIGLATVLRIVQPAPLGGGGPGGPGGFGFLQPSSMPEQQQRQQQSTGLKYLLDEENAGYFRGKWYASIYVYNCNSDNFIMPNTTLQ